MSFVGALALGASLLGAAPAFADSAAGSLAPLGCVGVNGSTNNGPSACATELPAGLSNVYEAVVSPDGRNVYEAVLGNEIAEFSRDPSTGTLTPLGSPADCVSAPDGGLTTEQCAQQTVSGLNGVAALAVSPDGKNVYAIGQDDNAVVAFSRDSSTGVLTQLSGDAACTAETSDASSSCANQTGYGLENAYGITVSPDGLNVYVASYGDHAVAEFHRDPGTGALTQFACASDSTFAQGYCTATADGLENAIGVSVSADGQNVYVAAGSTSGNGDIAEFSRDTSVPTSSPIYGELSQLPYPHDCITGTANLDPNVQCGDSAATGVNGPEDLTLSPDGTSLYANSFDANAVLEFSRNPATGVLQQLSAPNDCISSSGASGCGSTDAPSLSGPLGVAISPDGFDLYVADAGSSAVTILARDPSTGALSQLDSPDDCVTVNASGCGTNDVSGLTGARRLTVSPDGANVYVAAQNAPAVVELARTLPSADLGIAETGAPSAAAVGDSIEYGYTLTNAGPSDAADAIVSVQLSATTALSVASSSQGSCTGTATVVCDLGLLRSGHSASVTVKVKLPSAGTATATASVLDATDVGDHNPANNSVFTSTAVGMGSGTGLYVTQRDPSASANVASLTLGSFDDSLSAPVFAGAGGAGSFGIAVTPDGAHVYVTNDAGGNSISQYSVDPTTGALTPLVPATVADSQAPSSNPEDMAVDPTGRWVYVANPFGPSVSQLRIDPSTGALTMVNEYTSGLLTFPTGVAFSPDGKSLYVADYLSGNVVEFDVDQLTGALTPKGTATVSLPQPPGGSTPNPRRLVTAAIGGHDYLYVSDAANGRVDQFTIDPTTGELTAGASIGSDSDPTGLAVDPTSSPQSLYVAAQGSNVVDEYDIDLSTGALTAKASASISTGAAPDGVALAPDGQELYVGDSGDGNLGLYTIAADGTLAPDPTNPLVAAGSGPSTPVLHTLPAAPVAAPAPTGGALTQLAAPNDCVSGNPFGCNTLIAPSGALNGDYQTVVSPDGKSVYAAAYLGVLVEFSRDPSTGALTKLGCVSDGGSGCTTNDAAGSNNPRSLALSPDGDYLYVVGAQNELVTFSRDPSTGLLTWIGCLDAPSSADSRCSATANGLEAPNGVAVSPDGTSVYVTSESDTSIAWFTRDPSSGLLTQPAAPDNCISGDLTDPAGCAVDSANGLLHPLTIAVSPDSKNVYVSAGGLGPGGDVAEFSRDPTSGALTQLASPHDCLASSGTATCGDTSAVGFGGEEDIAISPDGRNVYLNSFSNSAVIELSRDPSSGVLTQLAAPNDCITSDSSNPGGCGSVGASALNGVQGVAVSPDGLDVYASSSGPVASTGASNAVDEFQRNPVTGALTQAQAPFECLTENGSGCTSYNVNGLGQPRRLTVSPDGLNVYAAGQDGTLAELARTPPSADLSLAQSGAATAVNVGDAITYSYTVSDLGPSAVDDAVVSVPLDSEEALTTASSSQGSCSGSATVRCDLGPLLAGGEATVTVTVSTTAAGTASVDASVADATDVSDPDTSNNDVTTSTVISELAPANTAVPVISGNAEAGQTLSATTGTWTGSPTVFTYDWQHCSDNLGNGCTTVQSGSSDQYTLLASDDGSFVQVVVTASNGTGPGSATSATVGPVTGSPANLTLPSISGTASAGHTLTASPGSWSGYPTPTFTYAWQDCPDNSGNGCSTVQSGASDHYTLLASDQGLLVRVVVTASNGVGADASATSAFTNAVTLSPANTSLPSISGTTTAGQTLTASPGVWSGYPAPTFSYAWEDCPDNSGNGCSTVQSGSSDHYTLLASDEGSLVRVVVTASNGVGADASATSAFTGAVAGPPVNNALPSLSGTATAGQTLHASTGSWSGYPAPTFTYLWQDCPDSSGNGCTTINGAASNAYVLAVTDEGSTVRVIVKASNGVGPVVSASSATTGFVTGAPANTALPSIGGTATAGQTLTATTGSWTGFPAPTFTYLWEDCPDSSGSGCSTVASGSSDQYTLATSDEGSFVRVVVTASNGAGPDASATSAAVGQVTGSPSNTALPSIAGTVTVGQTLTAAPGGWSGYPAPAFNYAWQDCPNNSGNGCSTVQSGASNQYTLLTADEGSLVRLVVTASNGVGSNVSATSAFTSAVTGAPANTSLPSITGTVSAGQTLTASSGGWSGYPAPTFNYAWQDCPDTSGNGCSTVQSSSNHQFTLHASDEGSRVRVVVTASNGVGANASATSAFTSAVTGAPVNATPPSISGTAQQGQTLSASPGSWTGNPAPTYNYQWQDCPDNSGNGCSTVQSGPSNQYTLLTADEGSLVRVIVTATNSVNHASATSGLTAAVTGPPVNGTPPAVTGTAQQGHTLDASTGSWSGYPAPTFTYTWQDCPNASGNGCQTINGAASNAYVLAASDEGSFVRVTVKASNGVGAAVSATSATTSVVSGAPANTVLPSIAGTASAGQTLTASAGSWSGYPAPIFTYAWQDCPDSSGNGCSTVQSGASTQYTLRVGDDGSRVRVVVTASNGVSPNASATSAQTSAVTGAPANTALPSISGTATAGQPLTASPGTWSGYPAPSFAYAWQDCTDSAGNGCSTVQSGASSQFTLSGSDAGLFVRVVVTASNGVGSNGSAASSTTVAVTQSPVNTQAPSISGTAQQGVPLSGSAGTWAGYPTPGFTYQWQDCDAQGNNCAAVASGGTSLGYTPTVLDVGHTLVLSVTAKNSAGQLTVASAPTAPVVIAPPANITPPAITGTAEEGDTLSASTGTWSNSPTSFTYAWQQCDSFGNNCTPVSGAIASSYVPVAADVGATLRVTVTASNALGPGSATSAQTAVVLIAAPVNTQLPAISGITGQGQQLSTSNGLWTNSPTSFSYQWEQCDSTGASCSKITTNATAGDYKTQAGDVGHTLRAIVTAYNAGGNSAATSAQSAIIGTLPANTAPPTVSGLAQQGQTLTSTTGSWSGTPAPTFSYQWEQCDGTGNNCSPIAGGSASGYTPVSGDVGHTLRASVIATNTAGSTTATSGATAAILIAAPANSLLPAVSGTAQPGQTLSASTGTWSNAPSGFGYQWAQCDSSGNGCAPIGGATTGSYVVGAGSLGHTLRVTVTASNAGGSAQATSAQSSPVSSAPPSNNAPPAITGTAQQGQTLSAASGGWTNSPTSFGYQWLQCDASGNGCSNIANATASSYTPAAADVGHTLRVTVTALNSSGGTPSTSAQSAVVAIAAPANTALPVIAGAAQQGQELSLSNGSWANSPSSFTYQWLRCDSAGGKCSPISGATGNKYVPASADGGHTLRATVTASNGGAAAAATSDRTAVVSSLQVSVAAPILGQTTNLAPVSGTVLVRLPGSTSFTPLTTATDLPLGSTIDARAGKVTLTVALPHGRTQTGQFYDGEFVLTQTSSGMTVLTLAGGGFGGCPATTTSTTTNGGASPTSGGASPTSGGASPTSATGGTTNAALAVSAKKKPKTVIRQLWGNAHGNYTTKGRYGSAAVSGTIWLTQDRCDGTYVKVTKDNVIVVAYAHPHTKHNIKQGHSILIPAPVH